MGEYLEEKMNSTCSGWEVETASSQEDDEGPLLELVKNIPFQSVAWERTDLYE